MQCTIGMEVYISKEQKAKPVFYCTYSKGWNKCAAPVKTSQICSLPAKINLKSILLAAYSQLSQKVVIDKLAKVVLIFLLNKIFRLEFFQSFHINVSAYWIAHVIE